MTGRRIITRDMLELARDMGLTNAQTARHYKMHASSISAACRRLGIMLRYAGNAPTVPSRRPERAKRDATPDKRVKAWSCKPAAIERALKAIQGPRAR